jgi:hypothetical protein
MIDKNIAESEFFSENNNYLLSYSALNKFLLSPKLFYNHYILKQKEDNETKYTVEGSLIHNILLDPDTVKDNFIFMPSDLPSDNIMKIINKVYNKYSELEEEDKKENLSDYQEDILEILKEINLYQSIKEDTKRLEKVITVESIKYWDYLKKAKGKKIVDIETYEYCLKAAEEIKKNEHILEALGQKNKEEDDVVENEYYASVDKIMHYNFGMKGILDNIVIKYSKKKVIINDFKTTSKRIKDFKESVEYYNYGLQAAIYKKLIEALIPAIKEEGFEIEVAFIVYDAYQQVYRFLVSSETMEKWEAELTEKLEDFNYHFQNKNFDLPKEFLLNEIKL